MTLLEYVNRIGLALPLGLAACQMPNPAFDGGQADELGSSADTSTSATATATTEVGESSDSGSSSDTNTSSSDAVDTDTTDSPMSDLPKDEECLAEFSDPYTPIYGAKDMFGGQCPPSIAGQFLKVTGPGPLPGLVLAQVCSSETCLSGCGGESIPLGVPGLADFSTPIENLQNELTKSCIKVQTGLYHGLDPSSRCVYESIWVGNSISDLMLALLRPSPLPAAGATLLQGVLPSPGQTKQKCSCESIYPADPDNLDCCLATMAQPEVSSLAFLEADTLPGGSGNVKIGGVTWTFHVAQAQVRPSCDNNPATAQTSWAVVLAQ